MENNYSELRETISKNIKKYRELLGLTQLELADKLNYSDKTLSKWERAESIPDIITLKQLADLFGITIDELLKEDSIIPNQSKQKGKNKRIIISVSLLSIGIVWLVMTCVFTILMIYNVESNFLKPWICFIYALPISFILLLIYSCIWGGKYLRFAFTSCLLWTIALAIHISLYILEPNTYLVYIICIPLQIMAFIFFIILKPNKKISK